MRKFIILIIILGIAGFIGFRIYDYSKKKAAKENVVPEERIVKVKTIKAARRNMRKILKLTGDIVGKMEVNVFPKVPGKLLKKIKKEGARVKKNETMAMIDRDEPGMKFSTAVVKAPISGIIFSYYSDIGDFVAPQSPILKIGAIDKVKVVTYLSEEDISKVKKNMEVRVKVDAYPDREFRGSVSKISPVVDPLTRKLKIEIEIPNEKHILKPGMFARAQIAVKIIKNAIAVPLKAIIENGEFRTIFIVKEGMTREVSIKLGIRDGDFFQVLSGLKGGEEVVVEGSYGLKENMRAKIAEEEGSSKSQ